ncbi:MAG: fibronectin type III domain-containing protein, partial [Clostridia bacterium]|nr:fibronectin type III domain-containing protein [Clostridia bacterium]
MKKAIAVILSWVIALNSATVSSAEISTEVTESDELNSVENIVTTDEVQEGIMMVSEEDTVIYAPISMYLTVTDVTETTAQISWTTNETGLVYDILLDGEIVVSDYTETQYTLSKLVSGTQYEISVYASYQDNEEYSAEAAETIYTDLKINSDKTIYYDSVVGDLYVTEGELNLNGNNLMVENISITGGTLNLNGGTLTVTGDVTQSGGTMNINGGKLLVDGDFAITGRYCYLQMTTENSYVFVSGEFSTSSY